MIRLRCELVDDRFARWLQIGTGHRLLISVLPRGNIKHNNLSGEFLRELLWTVHPGFRMDGTSPICKRRNMPEVFSNMLLADDTNRNRFSIGVDDGRTEDFLTHENPFGMMSQSPVTKICEDRFTLVEPVMDREIILYTSPMLLY